MALELNLDGGDLTAQCKAWIDSIYANPSPQSSFAKRDTREGVCFQSISRIGLRYVEILPRATKGEFSGVTLKFVWNGFDPSGRINGFNLLDSVGIDLHNSGKWFVDGSGRNQDSGIVTFKVTRSGMDTPNGLWTINSSGSPVPDTSYDREKLEGLVKEVLDVVNQEVEALGI
ncbi:MAG: hypothetical protein WC897_05100 [Candidatus Gracilibacteria bacterium]